MKHKNKIIKIYKKREIAYKTLLECDIAIDNLLKELK